MIAETLSFFKNRAVPLANELFCMARDNVPLAMLYALSGIYLKLAALQQASTFGANKFSIEPFTLTTTPQKILVKDISGRVRKVAVWVDSASGGPTPTIRVGIAASSANGGGVRVSAGQVNEIGEVPPSVELWAVASTSIAVYVLERS